MNKIQFLYVTEVSDEGVVMPIRKATPADIKDVYLSPTEVAALHPKCRTCDNYGWLTDDGDDTYIEHVCDVDAMVIINPDVDHCSSHSDFDPDEADDTVEGGGDD